MDVDFMNIDFMKQTFAEFTIIQIVSSDTSDILKFDMSKF